MLDCHSLAIAALNGGNAEWQRDPIVSHVKISVAGGNAKAHLAAAREIAEVMATEGILAPVDGWMVDDLRKRLAALE